MFRRDPGPPEFGSLRGCLHRLWRRLLVLVDKSLPLSIYRHFHTRGVSWFANGLTFKVKVFELPVNETKCRSMVVVSSSDVGCHPFIKLCLKLLLILYRHLFAVLHPIPLTKIFNPTLQRAFHHKLLISQVLAKLHQTCLRRRRINIEIWIKHHFTNIL